MNKRPVYLEVGGADGLNQVNIPKSVDNDALVIFIEANPRSHEQCKLNRPDAISLNYACSENDENDFILFNTGPTHCGLMGHIADMGKNVNSIEEPLKVPSTTLQKICDSLNVTTIDKMYLDVEGAEARVLRGLEKVKIKWLHLEMHEVDEDHPFWRSTSHNLGRDSEDEILKETKRLGLSVIGRDEFRNTIILESK
jgi:FkbM family methyltransferase